MSELLVVDSNDLCARIERQGRVIEAQNDILASLGFDLSDIADHSERELRRGPPRSEHLRLCLKRLTKAGKRRVQH